MACHGHESTRRRWPGLGHPPEPKVWEASGHLENFTDPLVDCKVCKARFREDKLGEAVCQEKKYKKRGATECQKEGFFTEARQFNLMFKTQLGPVEGSGADAYLRPETAQGIFTNFVNVVNAQRMKPPFGIAQDRQELPKRDHAWQFRLPHA